MQQKTLSKLRVAVSQQMAPRPSPKIYLPDRFKQATTELEDGTVVAVDDDEQTWFDGGDSDGARAEASARQPPSFAMALIPPPRLSVITPP